ncbi:MAG: type I restriction-modification system subunit M N-terminal domain-containing protein [Thermoleophilia bacterium]|nr:type I restriction-modification system subunit M N-terminal domain-containing protein [Thermoleophilia bacterium]
MAKVRNATQAVETGAVCAGASGCGAEVRRVTDALRGSMDAAEYKHVVLSLIVIKCVLRHIRTTGTTD